MSEAYRSAATRYGEARASAVEAKVRAAMGLIEREIQANSGIYPAKGGAVTMNELARRAGISSATLVAPKHKALRASVDAWLALLKRTTSAS